MHYFDSLSVVVFEPAVRRPSTTRQTSASIQRAGWPRSLVAVMTMLALLTFAGIAAARATDSDILGFVFADLLFIVGAGVKSALTVPDPLVLAGGWPTDPVAQRAPR